MINRAHNTDYRYRVNKLSVGKGNLKLRLQHSKRNNSKTKSKLNNLSINNDNNMQNSKINNNNSIINKNKVIAKDHSKENKNSKNINTRSKLLSITSNNNEIINFNNYLTNDNINKKNSNNDINLSNNENINNSYIHITLNSNNPYINQNIANITEEKEKEKEKEKENSKNIVSPDIKYNITVNKKSQINDNISLKERFNIREQNKNRVIKKAKRDLSAKPREGNFIFNKKIYLKEKNSSNYKKKNHSPLIESNNEQKNKINNSINSNNIHNNLHFYSHNSQKMKNISNINTISFSSSNNNNNVSNFASNNSNAINLNQLHTNPNEEEYFEYNNDKNQELTKDEKLIYGDRIMKGYFKKKLLGKGGCGIVWLCSKSNNNKIVHDNGKLNNNSFRKEKSKSHYFNDNLINTNEEYAVKQTSKKNGNALLNMANENIMTAKNEIKILSKLNNNESNNFIPKLYDYYEDSNDLWFSFEKGGVSISGLCFKIKGEFEKGERIYYIQKGKFLISLFSTISQFKYLLKSLLSAIDYINKKGIIHSDIKPENILIEYSGDSYENNFEIKSIKIIDYGSAFFTNNTAVISSNTPEYLCPEITIGNKKFIKELKNNNLKYINCIDIWSLGITILELCLCCPSWMSYKTKVIINGKIYHPSGLFGCRGREGNKIYQKQIELGKNINKKLKNSMLYLFGQNDRTNFIDLLKKMLEFDYRKRINCQDAINHPFFKD